MTDTRDQMRATLTTHAPRGGIVPLLTGERPDEPRRPLTGVAKRRHRRKVLIETAQEAMGDRHPDAIVALLTEAETAWPTHNPEPLRPEIRHAVRAADTALLDEVRLTVTRGGMDRPDVRLLPYTGPQSPGQAW